MWDMDSTSKAQSVGGGAVLGAMITGIGGICFRLHKQFGGHFEAGGIALVAAAVAFVGVANAIFRH